MAKLTLGLDFGTGSVRCLAVNALTGEEVATSVWNYANGTDGVIVDPSTPDLARQHPDDYLAGILKTVTDCTAQLTAKGLSASDVVGIGVDTTGSTPMPVTEDNKPLTSIPALTGTPAAMAWLWKDHTGHAEAAAITAAAAKTRPEYLKKCGGTYSSEWFWSKIWQCYKSAPDVFAKAFTWVEIADWIPAVLCGVDDAKAVKRGICAAGHKAMYHRDWGGYPDAEFLGSLEPALVRIRETLPDDVYSVAEQAGTLSAAWAESLGLPAGIPVAVGAFDAHLGAVGSGVMPGSFVKIMGTSTCDIAVWPLEENLPDIPGLCGIVPESVLPGSYGLEAGQSAVGDIFNWFVSRIAPRDAPTHAELTAEAERLLPGESGLLALDWLNGNRTVLVDQRLSGLLVGFGLLTTPAEIYRALVEATAYGARAIIERFEEYGVRIDRVVACGGISVRSPMTMQIYADVFNRPIEIARSEQTCALGSAMAASVVAGVQPDFAAASATMTGFLPNNYRPNPSAVATYEKLYRLYKRLHDLFGTREYAVNQFEVMKELLDLRDSARASHR